MKSESQELKKLLKQLYLLRLTLYLSFIIALASTIFAVSSSFFPQSGPPVPGYVAQTALANATEVTTTTLFSTTASTMAGYSAISNPSALSAFNYYGLTALVSWAIFAGAVIWRGHVRSLWGQSRFSYDTFRLLVKMRGAQTRLKLMHSLNPPKNKLQLATALGIDWKAVDKHVQVLEKNGLIQAASTNGTAKFYGVTEKGKNLMQLLEQLGVNTPLEE